MHVERKCSLTKYPKRNADIERTYTNLIKEEKGNFSAIEVFSMRFSLFGDC